MAIDPLVRRFRPLLLVLALSIALGIFSQRSAPAAATGATASDDAYHYSAWHDGQNDAFYTEWWYFNLTDPDQGLSAIFTYFIIDPANLTGLGRAQVAAVAYTPLSKVTATDVSPTSSFTASDQKANIQIQQDRIDFVDDSHYQISGASQDGRIVWDLSYARTASSWFAADRMPVGSFSWEKMSWLIYMPAAQVTGQLSVDGHIYEVHSSGYHDHNWGEWVFTDALWNWAQVSQPGLSIELGDFIGGPAGILGVDFQGRRTVFTKDSYTLLHTGWTPDPKNNLRYPFSTLLFAANEDTFLWLALSAVDTVPLRGDLPFPLPDPVIYEQTAAYNGQLWRKAANGAWSLAADIRSDGFKEYTANAWP